jgi:hypothetical protein
MRMQADVRSTTTWAIMRSPEFVAGVNSVRNGIAPDYDFDSTWDYERGRLWACLAPPTMPLKIKGKLNPLAVALFELAFTRKYLI